MRRTPLLLAFLALAGCSDGTDGSASTRAALVDFEAGITAQNHPEGAGVYGVWYDAAHNTFGTPSAATLDGARAMRIDDGGFANGVYTIIEAAVPADGTYRVEVPIHVVESAATSFDGVRRFQVGVAPGGTHRGPNPSALPGLSIVGEYAPLTAGDDTAIGTTVVATGEFAASAGDDLLLALGTDVTSGGWNGQSGFWNGAYVLVGRPRLVPIVVDPSIVVDDDDGAPGYTQSGAWSTSGSPGYDGGRYRYGSTGGGSSASWTAALLAGFYRVEVIYRAGANRTPDAHYTVHDASGVLAERRIDQRYRDLSWVRLGLIEVVTAGDVTVTLDADGAAPGAVMIADAVRFFPLDGPPPIDPPEIRMASITVFDDVDDVGAIQATVDELEALHYNAVAVHARYRGDATYVPNRADTTYESSEPRSPAAGDVDVLAEYVERGHRAGLRVFAYVNTHLVTDGSNTPTDPAHVIHAHPEWRTWAYAGGTPVVQDLTHDGEGLWLDPALPEVRRYLADIAGDIASNYDVDGIVLDRIRYPQTSFTRENRDFGYHPDAVRRFHREQRHRWTRHHAVPDPRDPEWIAFRQRAVTETVGAIHDRLAEIDPEMLLLAFPIGRFDDARDFNYQDWPAWLNEHRIDGVLPQIYTSDTVAFRDRLRQHLDAYAGDRLLGVSIDAFRAGVDIEAQIAEARAEGFDGSAPFRHGTLATLGYVEPLQRAWDGVAPFPSTPWASRRIRPLVVRGTCEGDAASTRWRVTNDNVESIAFEWRMLLGGDAVGAGLALPGESVFETPGGRPVLLLVRWHDDRGRERRGVGIPCARSRRR